MDYCIVTPTYAGHFKYIDDYLKSFLTYVVDAKEIPIYFILDDLSEKHRFEKIVEPYSELKINILYFESILREYDISDIPDVLMFKYGKYSYQTLKKLYSMLYIEADFFLILDSESMWVRRTNMSELFMNFFAAPFIMGSSRELRMFEGTYTEFIQDTLKAVEIALENECKYIFQEHFTWFYTKQIVEELCKRHGMPLEIVDKVYRYEMLERGAKFGLMELSLLHEYIFENKERYGYKFIDVEEALKHYMGVLLYEEYRNSFIDTFYGQMGIIEFPFNKLEKKYVRPLGKLFLNNGISILRCTQSKKRDYLLQKRLARYAKPNILAASQNHWFGLKRPSILKKLMK